MASELDLLTLAGEAIQLAASDGHRWTVSLVDNQLKAFGSLTPEGSSDVYCLRMDFGDALAAGPASVTFCDPSTRAEGQLSAWPRGLTEYFKAPPNNGNGWICNPWTREGRAQHPEWQSYGWRPRRALWTTLTAIQDILDTPGAYSGRAQV